MTVSPPQPGAGRGAAWWATLAVMREVIFTPDVPTSPLFSQAVRVGPQVFLSGLIGVDVRSGSLAGDTIQTQTRQALRNCESVLRAAGATLDDVVEVGVLLTRPTDFDGMNAEYAGWFGNQPPTRSVAKLGAEPTGVLVSIRMTAIISESDRQDL